MMNPEGEKMVDERREAEIQEVQSRIRAGIDTAPVVPSKVFTLLVRKGKVLELGPDNIEESK